MKLFGGTFAHKHSSPANQVGSRRGPQRHSHPIPQRQRRLGSSSPQRSEYTCFSVPSTCVNQSYAHAVLRLSGPALTCLGQCGHSACSRGLDVPVSLACPGHSEVPVPPVPVSPSVSHRLPGPQWADWNPRSDGRDVSIRLHTGHKLPVTYRASGKRVGDRNDNIGRMQW